MPRRTTSLAVSFLLTCLVTILALPLSVALFDVPSHQHGRAWTVEAANDHRAMFAGGVPGVSGPIPLQALRDCDGEECIEAAGLGDQPPSRSYTTEQPLDLTIYRTVDTLSCHPQHKDTHEVGIFFFYDPNVKQYHNYGPPAPGAATDGCVRWHAQAHENFVGRQIGQVGIDGTGSRAPVALVHSLSMEVPNPCWGKPCAGPFTGRYLSTQIKSAVFQIAIGSGGEVWYIKQNQAGGYQRHLNGHTFGQDRIPFYPTYYTNAAGQRTLAMHSAADGAFQWNTCGYRATKRPGDEGVPCVKSHVDAARGSLKGRSVQNPNTTLVPQDRFGNRLVPLAYHWVKCLDDQAEITQPAVQTGDGAWLNPHEWTVRPASVIRPVQPAACAYRVDIQAATEFPPAGMVGVPNGPPAPVPTGAVPTDTPAPGQTPLPTVEPTDTPAPTPTPTDTPVADTPTPAPTDTPAPQPTATPAPADWRVPMPVDVVDWWASDVYHTEAKPPPDAITSGAGVVDHTYGDGPPREDMPADGWTAVHYGTWPGGPIQALRVRCDDDCRVVINDVVEWDGVAYSTIEFPITHVDPNPVPVRVEHRDTGGNAYVRVEFIRPPALTGTPTP